MRKYTGMNSERYYSFCKKFKYVFTLTVLVAIAIFFHYLLI